MQKLLVLAVAILIAVSSYFYYDIREEKKNTIAEAVAVMQQCDQRFGESIAEIFRQREKDYAKERQRLIAAYAETRAQIAELEIDNLKGKSVDESKLAEAYRRSEEISDAMEQAKRNAPNRIDSEIIDQTKIAVNKAFSASTRKSTQDAVRLCENSLDLILEEQQGYYQAMDTLSDPEGFKYANLLDENYSPQRISDLKQSIDKLIHLRSNGLDTIERMRGALTASPLSDEIKTQIWSVLKAIKLPDLHQELIASRIVETAQAQLEITQLIFKNRQDMKIDDQGVLIIYNSRVKGELDRLMREMR